jgi:hypothetical protein
MNPNNEGHTMTSQAPAASLSDAAQTTVARATAAHRILGSVGLNGHAQRILDAATAAAQSGDTLDSNSRDYLEGRDAHVGSTPEYRRQMFDQAQNAAAFGMVEASELLPDFVDAATAELVERCIPRGEVSDYAAVKDATLMVLDSVVGDPNPQRLLDACLELIENEGTTDDNDVAFFLTGRVGRAYFAKHGKSGSYDALLSRLRERAPMRGSDARRKAAQAYTDLQEHIAGVRSVGQVAAARSSHYGITNPTAPPGADAPTTFRTQDAAAIAAFVAAQRA